MNVPMHVMEILVPICGMYNVVKTCIEQGDKDTLSFLESFGVDVGVKNSIKDEDTAVTAQVVSNIIIYFSIEMNKSTIELG